jgi:hydrogenase-4 membrane subunit HyfE
MFNRNVLAGVVGLFLLDAGASVAGASFAVQLPEALEMGAAFDALVLTVVAVMLARAIARHDASLDVRSLRRLRG